MPPSGVKTADAVIDPSHEMFFYPKGTLHLSVVTPAGKTVWTKELGRGIVPGIWFCPVFPFDMDGDGVDEIPRASRAS